MNQNNLLNKYNITREELDKGIETVSKNLGKICDAVVMLAVCDLLVNGDIQDNKETK